MCGKVVSVCVRRTGALPNSVGEIEVSDFRNWVVGFDATPGVLVQMCEECIMWSALKAFLPVYQSQVYLKCS